MRSRLHCVLLLALLGLAACSNHGDTRQQSQSNGMAVAKAAFDSAQYDKAERLYQALLADDATLEEAQLMLARTRYQQDKKQAARDGLQQLLDKGASRRLRPLTILASFCWMMV